VGSRARRKSDAIAGADPLVARYRVQVLERALGLLDALGAANREVGPAELSEILHLHKSTIHRLLKVLEGYRFVRRNPQGKYDLGLKLFELGNMSVSRFSLPRRAEPFLKDVVRETGETAQICVLNNTQMVSIANADAPWLLRAIGHRGELHSSASGKAFLAFLPRPAQDLLLSRLTLTRFTHNTITTLPALKSELARVRRKGFAVNNEEVEPGVRCIGAPIFDHNSRVIATLSIAGPVFRMTRDRVPDLARTIVNVANALSSELGHPEAASWAATVVVPHSGMH
jgi:IclR family KDG regulon transcriptional repressor